MSNLKNRLRVVGGLVALAGGVLCLFSRSGVVLLIVGLVLLAVAVVLPGSWYGDPPDPTSAPTCPQCGLQMIFVEYWPDAVEYQCKEHGRYMLDSEGLFSSPQPRVSTQKGLENVGLEP